MAIDISKEKLYPLDDLLKLNIPKRLHKSTVWRWHRKGVGGVKIEVVKCGKTVCSSIEALQRFLELTAAQPSVSPKTANSRKQAIAVAQAKLKGANI